MTLLLQRTVGVLLALVGLVFFLASLVALVDPVGTQMADDSNPFGPPPPWYAAVTGCVVSAGIGAGGIWLLRRKARMDGRAV